MRLRHTMLRVIATCAAALLAPSEARAVVTCGQVVSTPGVFTVTDDLVGCTGHGLRVTASDVTIECASGVSITGVEAEGQYGISVEGPVANVHVRDCEIAGFNRGIRYRNVTGGSITTNLMYDFLCTPACGNTSKPYGIDLTGGSSGITVDGNEIYGKCSAGPVWPSDLRSGTLAGDGAAPNATPQAARVAG